MVYVTQFIKGTHGFRPHAQAGIASEKIAVSRVLNHDALYYFRRVNLASSRDRQDCFRDSGGL